MFQMLVTDKFLEVLKTIPSDTFAKLVDATVYVEKVPENDTTIEAFITNILRRI